MQRIAILGPGGVGGLLAAALDRAGAEVAVVARESTAETIARDGIAVRSSVLGDFTGRPAAVARLSEPVDALLVATKAAALEDALARVEPAVPALVVPLLNGFDHMALLRERFGGRVAAGTIRVQADRTSPGQVVQSGSFLFVELASDDPPLRPALASLAAALEAAGVEARARGDRGEARILWGKLVRLNALACTTAAYDATFGAIRADPERRAALEGCVREGVAVARAEGAELDAKTVFGEFERDPRRLRHLDAARRRRRARAGARRDRGRRAARRRAPRDPVPDDRRARRADRRAQRDPRPGAVRRLSRRAAQPSVVSSAAASSAARARPSHASSARSWATTASSTSAGPCPGGASGSARG